MSKEWRRPWTAIGVFLAAWIFTHAMFEIDIRFSDVPLFRRYGEAITDGSVPYRDVALEYPPGALPAFVVPALVSSDLDAFRIAFEAFLMACGAAMLAAMHSILLYVQAPRGRSWLVLLFVAISPLLLGRVMAERYDLWPASLATIALAGSLTGRHRMAGAALALGATAKFFPVALLPLLGWWAWRQGGRDAALRFVGAFVLLVIVCLAPFVAASPSGVLSVLDRQLERSLQIESIGAALLLGLHQGAGLSLGVEASFGSINLGGSKAAALAAAQSLLLLIVLAFVWFRFARSHSEPEALVVASAVAVTAVVVLGKVLSPQFLIWALPLVPLVGGRRGLTASALLAAACLVTQLLFPSYYLDLIRLDGTASVILIVRNLLLAALLVVLVRACLPRGPTSR